MIYVNIDGVEDKLLKFVGFTPIMENDDFKLYLHTYTGTEHIVSKKGKRFLWVEDWNDAAALQTKEAVAIRDVTRP